jgi:hypothetical protein
MENKGYIDDKNQKMHWLQIIRTKEKQIKKITSSHTCQAEINREQGLSWWHKLEKCTRWLQIITRKEKQMNEALHHTHPSKQGQFQHLSRHRLLILSRSLARCLETTCITCEKTTHEPLPSFCFCFP